MHMRISYLFLAGLAVLHVTRYARETYLEAHPEYLNKPCGVELVTSRNRDYRP